MKTKIAVLFAAIGYLWNGASASNAATCRRWECQEGLGGGMEGANRVCANFTDSVSVAEQCRPDAFLCDVPANLDARANCTEFSPLPWKRNMPPGDSCTTNAECQSNNCTETGGRRLCQGLARNATCTADIDCSEGNFCYTNPTDATRTCQPVIRIGQPCSGAARCEFGTLCANHTCTRVGSLATGTFFNITDDERFTAVDTDARPMYWICQTFYAVITEFTSAGGDKRLFECTNGPEKAFTDYTRTDGNLDCIYNMTRVSGGGVTLNFTEQAKCGFNRDDKFYCPSRRGANEFSKENAADRTTWSSAPNTCHHRTTMQYCKDVEGNIGRSLGFRNFMLHEWRTTGDNWPLVANNDRCVGNAIAATRNYWRLIDSAVGTMLSYAGFVASLFVMTFVY